MSSKKKAVSPVLVMILLLLASVLIYSQVAGWFQGFKSDFEVGINSEDFYRTVEVEKIDGTSIYVRNDFRDNLGIESIKIGGVECNIGNTNLSKGLQTLDVGNCTAGLQNITAYDVVLVTSHGVKQEKEIIRNVIEDLFLVSFSSGACPSGYTKIYGLSDSDNAHAELANSSSYSNNLCIRHLSYTLGTSTNGNSQTLFYLTEENNSAVWTTQDSIYEEPSTWYPVAISSSGGTFSFSIAETAPGIGYECIGAIDQDDVYGSHIEYCSGDLTDKLWLKLE